MSGVDIRGAASRRIAPKAREVSSRGRTVTYDPTRFRATWARYEQANRAAHADYAARHGLPPLAGYAEEHRQYLMRLGRRLAVRR